MPIYLPEATSSTIQSLTPRQIVAELDKYVVGQHQAKRAAEGSGTARHPAEERVLALLLPPLPPGAEYDEQAASIREQAQRTREKLREQLRDGRLDHKQVDIEVRERSFPSFEIIQGGS